MGESSGNKSWQLGRVRRSKHNRRSDKGEMTNRARHEQKRENNPMQSTVRKVSLTHSFITLVNVANVIPLSLSNTP